MYNRATEGAPARALMMPVLLLLLFAAPAWSLGVQLSWEYSDNVLAPASTFVVYRDVRCLNAPVILGTVPWATQGTPTFTDTSVVPLTTYCYFVSARTAGGEESVPSNTVAFQVPEEESEVPFAPTHLHGRVIP